MDVRSLTYTDGVLLVTLADGTSLGLTGWLTVQAHDAGPGRALCWELHLSARPGTAPDRHGATLTVTPPPQYLPERWGSGR